MPRFLKAVIALGLFASHLTVAHAYPNLATGTIPLSVQPSIVKIGPTGRFLYVADQSSGNISIVDTLFFSEIGKISITGIPADLALSNDGTALYVVGSATDSVTKFDLTDPSAPTNATTLSIGTSGVTFNRLGVGGVSGADILSLLSEGSQAVYAYDVKNSTHITNGSSDSLSLGFTPADMMWTAGLDKALVLGAAGEVRVVAPQSLSLLAGSLSLSSLTSSPSFKMVSSARLAAGDYGFATNSLSPGELFILSISSLNVVSALDADLSTGVVDPVVVGNNPMAVNTAQVKRSKSDATQSGFYVFVANQGDGTLSVIDTAAIGGGAKITPIDTIANVPNVPARGLTMSSPDENYLYAANMSASQITVVTDQPMISFSSVPTGTVGEADASVMLRSTLAGTLSVSLYNGKTTDAVAVSLGTLITSLAIEANTDTSVTFPTASLQEGANTIAFFVNSGNLLGRSALTISKRVTPSTPGGFSLSFGNEKIIARWDRVDISDLSHYLVYFGTNDPSGGVGTLISPHRVDQTESGSYTLVLEPVSNGTTVYAHVTAVNTNGDESPPTDTLSATAEQTIGILDLTSEKGGCGTIESSGFLLLIVSGLLFLIGRSKRWPILIVVGALGIVPRASAQTVLRSDGNSPVRSSMEFRVGWWMPQDKILRQFLGRGGNEIYQFRYGLCWRFLDFGLEGGLLSEDAPMVGVTSGLKSGESMSVTLVPMEFSVQGNLQWTPKPLVVPFVRVGYDLTYFKVSQPGVSKSGEKHQTSFTGGLRLNVERFGSGNDLEDLMGIKHLFLEGMVTYRHQFSEGIDFGGWIIQPGLGVEF